MRLLETWNPMIGVGICELQLFGFVSHFVLMQYFKHVHIHIHCTIHRTLHV